MVACSFVKQVRQDHLIDQLSDGLAMMPERRRPEHLLHVAALLYASRDSDLRHLIEDRLDDWAAAVGIEPSLVIDYLRMAGPYADEAWIERLREAAQAPPDDGFAADLDRLLRLLAAGRAWEEGELVQATELAARLRPALRARARYGAAGRVLVTPPLDRLAPVYKVHAARFGMLAELWQNQRALEGILRSVLEAPPPPAGRAPQTFAELVAALSPLLVAPPGAAPSTLVMDGEEYPVDPGGFVRALRGSDADRLLADFLARTPEDTSLLFFREPADRQPVSLRVSWPSGLSGARTRTRLYSREAFEQTVKPAVLATAELIERMAGRPAQAQRLRELLDEALDAYGAGYDEELEGLYASFAVDVTSEAGARRVLAALAGKRSPLRELVRVVSRDAALGLTEDTSGLFDPMLDAEERFGGLSSLFEAGKGGEAFVGYQDVLREVGEKLAAPPAAGAKGGDGLSSRVSRAGALAVDLMAGAKGNPLDALAAWEGENGLSEELAGPFRAPLRAVLALGARDVERELAAWNRDLERSAGADLFSRFPFDRRSPDDVDPEAIVAWLHPKSGRLTMEIAPVVASLVQRTHTGEGRWHHASAHPCGGGGVCVDVPARLLDTLDRLASSADLFWDEAGKPRPIALEVTPRPFTLAGRGGPVPELVRLSAGESSVFYFNQRPRRSRVEVDWTRDQVASLSVQLEQGSLSLTPPALVVGGSPWSLLRLMQQAERRGSTHTFRVPLDDVRVLAVGYDVVDPTAEALGAGGAVAAESTR
jgi:type VI secretion system protein ImpL